jgi:hypothetical protein
MRESQSLSDLNPSEACRGETRFEVRRALSERIKLSFATDVEVEFCDRERALKQVDVI